MHLCVRECLNKKDKGIDIYWKGENMNGIH